MYCNCVNSRRQSRWSEQSLIRYPPSALRTELDVISYCWDTVSFRLLCCTTDAGEMVPLLRPCFCELLSKQAHLSPVTQLHIWCVALDRHNKPGGRVSLPLLVFSSRVEVPVPLDGKPLLPARVGAPSGYRHGLFSGSSLVSDEPIPAPFDANPHRLRLAVPPVAVRAYHQF